MQNINFTVIFYSNELHSGFGSSVSSIFFPEKGSK